MLNSIERDELNFISRQLDSILESQKRRDDKIEDIRVQLAELGTLGTRMDYIERSTNSLAEKVDKVESKMGDIDKRLAEWVAKDTVESRWTRRDIDEGKSERKEIKQQVFDFIKEWGPWAGFGLLGFHTLYDLLNK